MDAFKSHQLFSPEDLKDKREYENADEGSIELAVQAALRKLRKKKNLYADAVKQNTEALNDEAHEHFEDKHKKKNVTAKELIDEVVKDEIKSHGGPSDKEDDDDSESGEDAKASSRSSFDDDQIHKKLAEISLLEKKLAHLVRQVKHYLRKKKAHVHKSEGLEDNDDVESILAEADDKKKRNGIPHTSVLEKFRNNPGLVDKYMANILNDDSDTANGDQRDLLGKKDMETGLLRDIVPGEINSIPLSRLDKESDDYESMATDRGVARDAMVESPFSILDIKKTTGKKFRHNLA